MVSIGLEVFCSMGKDFIFFVLGLNGDYVELCDEKLGSITTQKSLCKVGVFCFSGNDSL